MKNFEFCKINRNHMIWYSFMLDEEGEMNLPLLALLKDCLINLFKSSYVSY